MSGQGQIGMPGASSTAPLPGRGSSTREHANGGPGQPRARQGDQPECAPFLTERNWGPEPNDRLEFGPAAGRKRGLCVSPARVRILPQAGTSQWVYRADSIRAQGSGGWGQASTSSSGHCELHGSERLQGLDSDLRQSEKVDGDPGDAGVSSRVTSRRLQKSSTSAPDETAVDTLNKDLSRPSNGTTPDFTQGQLKTDLEAVIKSAGADDDATVTKLEGDLNAVAQAMNITSDDVATIQADQKAIADDGGPTLPDTTGGSASIRRSPQGSDGGVRTTEGSRRLGAVGHGHE